MAPRRQAKQAAAESVVAAAADGNVTPPKKRKVVAKQVSDEPKQIKGRTTRQAKADKQESEAGGPASPPKKSRGKQKNAASPTAAAKTDTRSKSKKQTNKEPEDATVDSHAGEEVAEKRTRGGKTATTAKKAGTKATTAKPRAKAPAAKKQKTRATDEEDAGNSGKNAAGASPAKRTTRRMKMVEESDAQAKPPAKASRKRKNADEAILEAQATKEEEEEEEENEVKVAKKPRSRAKKVEPNDAPVTTSRGRAKKNPAKEVAKPPPEEVEIKKQNGKERNAAVQEDNSKAKNVKNAKKGNAKKAAPKGKLNAAAGKADEQAQAEEAAILEVDVKENGEAHVAELKQKKRNAGKAIAAMNGKVEAKGRQKKGQATATSIDEKEATKDETNETSENETTEMNVAPEIDEADIKDVSLIKDDNVLQSEEKATDFNDSKPDSTKNDSDSSIKEMERSGTFLCF